VRWLLKRLQVFFCGGLASFFAGRTAFVGDGDAAYGNDQTPDATKPALGGFCFASYLVGRGNLNLDHNFLIFNDIYGLSFVVEYHLEYRFPKRYFAWDSNLRPSRMLGLSAGRSLN
jgi:hypothetical protein